MMQENDFKEAVIVEEEKMNERKKMPSNFPGIAVAFVLGALIMYVIVKYIVPPIDNSSTIINKSEKEVTVTDTGIADAVEKLYDAVVVVEVYKNDTLSATGTGFVYKKADKKAYILTNNHVVAASGKVKIKVKFTNGTEEEVEIEGQDEYSDLAVLSLDAEKVEFVAAIGENEKMRLGDTVFTIGAPLDTEYYWTVTRGILSGKDRMVEVSLSNSSTSDYVMRVLQTDASINSGNSGGPLANSNGEVIGITNMKLVSSGVEGIGFAIPIEDAIDYAETIINGDEVQRPLLGVKMWNLDDRYTLYQNGITLNTELTKGVVVIEVQKNTPAANSGLKRGDIITKLGNYDVNDLATLRYALYKYKVGDTVTVTYEREGKEKTTDLKLNVAS